MLMSADARRSHTLAMKRTLILIFYSIHSIYSTEYMFIYRSKRTNSMMLHEVCFFHGEFIEAYREDDNHIYARCPKCTPNIFFGIIDKKNKRLI